jgi:tRNA A-37 threonylcarbamoyl transferase component Bud32
MGWFGWKKTTGEPDAPEEPPAPAEEPRRRIGKYEVIEKIATGGFGTVYKAWDPMIRRPVALKTCELPDAVMRARVFREARLAGGLKHPNITTVYEFGVDGIVPFLAQELLSGGDLDKVIAREESLPITEKVRILIDIASALDHAHRAGVIHRDVKPANIRILDNGDVKIMDFGIAKSLDSTTNITKDGTAVGSTSYMSPEQIVGEAVDSRTDIFSFGVVAYEILSGVKPFAHEKLFLLLEQIVKTEPAPLSKVAPQVPPSLVAVVERAMRKKPEDRFASAGELEAALESVMRELGGLPTGAEEAPRDRETAGLDAPVRDAILDTAAETDFDDITRLASALCEAPLASLSFGDRDRLWFKSTVGFDRSEIPLWTSFGAWALEEPDVLVVRDTAEDDRFSADPFVRGAPGVRFYAGAPLRTGEGRVLGALCVMDRQPRELSAEQIESLRALSRQAVAQLELRRLKRAQAGGNSGAAPSGVSPPPPAETEP